MVLWMIAEMLGFKFFEDPVVPSYELCDECGKGKPLTECHYCGFESCYDCEMFYSACNDEYIACWDCGIEKLEKKGWHEMVFSYNNFKSFISYLRKSKHRLKENKIIQCVHQFNSDYQCRQCKTTLCSLCNQNNISFYCELDDWEQCYYMCYGCAVQNELPEEPECIYIDRRDLKYLKKMGVLFKLKDKMKYKKVANLSLKLKVFLNGRLPYKYVQMEVLERGCTMKPREIIEIV